MNIRVLIVDDHPVVVDGLTIGLAQHAIEVAGSAATLAQAKAMLDREQVDVVLLDLRLPDGSGTELLRSVQTLATPPAFVILSSFRTQEYLEVTMRLGAKGYVLKTAPTEQVVGAVRRAAAGLPAFSPQELMEGYRGSWAPLSQREHEILQRLVAGRSNDEIAADLGVSTKRIEVHLSRMYERYGVGSRVELALRAEREQWLDLPVADGGAHP